MSEELSWSSGQGNFLVWMSGVLSKPQNHQKSVIMTCEGQEIIRT